MARRQVHGDGMRNQNLVNVNHQEGKGARTSDSEHLVGMPRSRAAPSNGFGQGLMNVTRQSSDQNPMQPLVSPVASSGSISPGFAYGTSSGGPQRTGPCAKCGRIGDKCCIICKLLYCSRECQRADWPHHKKICLEEDVGVEKPEESISRNRSGELHCEQTQAVCIVPPFSPSEFYICLKSDQQKLVDIERKLGEFYKVPNNQRRLQSLPKVRDFCMCRFSADNSWYRAEVEAVTGQKITVRYVDYGNKEDTTMANMCEMSDQFKSMSYLTVRCRLADVEPQGPEASGDAWSEKAIRYIQETVPPCAVLTMTAFCIKEDTYHVKLLLPDGTNVTEKLIDAGLARRLQEVALTSPPVQISRSPDEKQQEEIKQRFSDYGWPSDLKNLIGQRMITEIVDYESNGDLWIRFDPLPGHTAPPMMRVLVTDSCLFAERRGHINGNLAKAEVEKLESKAHRCLIQDLPKLELENKVKVEVTVVRDDGTFYCQDLLQMAQLVGLQRNLTAPDQSSLSAYVPEENEICLGFYESIRCIELIFLEYSEWYRVEVLDQQDSDAFVFLIDYGEKMRIPLTLLLPLPKELSGFPPLAFHCQLSAWSRLKALSPDVPKLFEEIVTNKPLLCETLSHDQTSGVRFVILSNEQSAKTIASDLFMVLELKGL